MPRKKKTPAAPVTEAPATNDFPASLVQIVKDAHNAREDHVLTQMVQMASADPTGFAGQLLVHAVVKAAVQVLYMEHMQAIGWMTDEADVIRARDHFTRAFQEAWRVLGANFDAMYTAKIAEHNAGARSTLDQSKGTTRSITAYVMPHFEMDGTHAPLGARDFPWDMGGGSP